MKQADWLVDLGPGAGKDGGQLVVSGTYPDLLRSDESPTAAYLSGREGSDSRR